MKKFSPEQQMAIDHKDGNMVVVSSAGSGKTTVIVNRVAKLIETGVKPSNILCITFSKKAKDNMITRLQDLCPNKAHLVHIETFHSLSLKIIKSESPTPIKVWTNDFEKQKAIRKIITENKLLNKDAVFSFNVANFLSWVGTAKNKMLNYTQQKEIMSDETLLDKFPNSDTQGAIYFPLWEKYEEYKQGNSLVEFDDMVNLADELLNNSDILKKYTRKFKYILSDEYQDTSMNRALLIKLLSTESNGVFVVGDPLQCIFGFTGADNSSIMEFDKEYNGQVVHMNTNYRSSGSIINLANTFADCMEDSKHRNYKPVRAFKESGGKPTYTRYLTDRKESEEIVSEIKTDIDNGTLKPNEVAILSRTNAQLGRIQMALFKNGLKFTLVDGTGFTQLREIRFVLNYMRVAYSQRNDFALEQILNMPPRRLDIDFLDELKATAERNKANLYESLDYIPSYGTYKRGITRLQMVVDSLVNAHYPRVSDYVNAIRHEKICEDTTFEDYLIQGLPLEDQEDIKDNLDMFQSICDDFGTLQECIQYFSNMNAQFYANEEEDNSDKVSLMSLHKSKGLEFSRVYIIGIDNGLLPHARNNDLESEKRLFYVGVTRAMNDLRLSSCAFIRGKTAKESPFINEIRDCIQSKDEDSLSSEIGQQQTDADFTKLIF